MSKAFDDVSAYIAGENDDVERAQVDALLIEAAQHQADAENSSGATDRRLLQAQLAANKLALYQVYWMTEDSA